MLGRTGASYSFSVGWVARSFVLRKKSATYPGIKLISGPSSCSRSSSGLEGVMDDAAETATVP